MVHGQSPVVNRCWLARLVCNHGRGFEAPPCVQPLGGASVSGPVLVCNHEAGLCAGVNTMRNPLTFVKRSREDVDRA